MSGAGQLTIDFDYDERSVKLAREVALMLVPHLAPGTTTETVWELASRIAMLATKELKYEWEPPDPILCHLCDVATTPKNRVRVVMCPRCSAEPRSPGSRG